MTHKQHRPPMVCHILHLPQTLLLKLRIPHGQHFVDDEDLGFEVGGYGKAEADLHAGRVEFDGGIDMFFHPAEVDDLVQFAVDLFFGHAEDGAVHVDVLAAGQFGVEAGADLQQCADPSFEVHFAGGGFGDVGEDLEQGALAGAVVADDAEHFALFDLEVDVPERPEHAFVLPLELAEPLQLPEVAHGRLQHGHQLAGEGVMAFLPHPEAVALGEVLDFDDGVGHWKGKG